MITSLLLVSLVCNQADADAAKSEIKLKVERLVRQLDDLDSQARRNAAEEELLALGTDVLDLLPPITPRTSAELKERLTRVRRSLEKIAAEASKNPSLVTLKGKMTVAEALAAFEKQTGNRVMGARDRGGMVDVNFVKTRFWEALDNVLDQANLTINPYAGETRALVVQAVPEGVTMRSGHADYKGIFRFEPVQANAVRDLRTPQVNAMRVTVEVGWEPRTLPISLSIPMDQLVAIDEHGKRITADTNQRELEASVSADLPVTEFILPFSLPSRDSKKIQSLTGQLLAMIPGRTEKFEFSDIGKVTDVQQKRAGVTVTLERVRRNVDVYEVRMRVAFDKANNALESHRGWIYNNEAYLLDPKGKKIMFATFNSTRQDINEVGIAYLFALEDGIAGHKFVYETPAAIVRMPVEFKLKEIELP